MSFFSKMFVTGICAVGLLLASSSDAEAGRRHRHRGHHGGGCHSAPASCCGQAYAAPVSNGCCTTGGGYGATGAYGTTNYGGQMAPQMAPSGQGSPSDLPANSQPPAPPAGT